MTLYNHSDINKRKTWLLLGTFFVLVIVIGYLFSWVADNPLILYVAVVFSFLSSFFSYWFSDRMILSLSRARQIKLEDNRELYRLVENLCLSAGLPLPKIYIIDDPAPNALATGRNPRHSSIALTSGLLNKLERSELEGVIAHELAHVKNYDILISSLTTVLVGLVVLLADWFRRFAFQSKSNNNNGKNQLNLIVMIVAIVFSLLAPLFAYLMQFAVSRRREFVADADGALLTRYPEGLARALEKISVDPTELRSVNRATAHLYISEPIKKKDKMAFFTRAFMTHPPVEDRIKALRGLSDNN